MNGRVYDPAIARFLSTDLGGTHDGDIQSYNRMAYVDNSPLIVIVDDSPEKIARQPRNHLRVEPYLGQADDQALLWIAEELLRRAKNSS